MPVWIERETAYEMINEAMTAGIVNVYTAEQRRTDFEEALEAIEAVPTADVEPVRHGKWIEKHKKAFGRVREVSYDCSYCGNHVYCKYNYCYNCGAKMDGGNENESQRNH